MKTKNPGITIIIAMGTSLIVLGLAFATINSVGQSLEQAGNIQRSTQLFFAAESGLEAAFFHHNSRGQGVAMSDSSTQTLDHDEIGASTEWSLAGRSTGVDENSDAFYADVLRENQTVQIPLTWDTSANPTVVPNTSGEIDPAAEEVTIKFYSGVVTTGGAPAETPDDDNIRAALAANFDDYSIDPTTFDFGNVDDEVLIDWSVSRRSSDSGVQTFIPTGNDDCSAPGTPGYICESQFSGLGTSGISISTTSAIVGKVLPGLVDTNLSDFWDCDDPTTIVTTTCSNFRFTFRPLLSYSDSIDPGKIVGIPFAVIASDGTNFPLPGYTVDTDVTQENFSQAINLEVPERTSIGVFDYVVFD